MSASLAAAGYLLYKKKNKGTTPSGGGSSNASGGDSSGMCSGEWKKGGVMTFYDVFHASDGDGSVAGLDFKPVKSMYDKENVVSVIDKDWKTQQFKYADLRLVRTPTSQQDASLDAVNPFTVKIIDYCSDKDCGGAAKGCCSGNLKYAKKFANVDRGMLFDVEQRTLQRAVGSSLWSKVDDAGVLNVEYRLCDKKVPKSYFDKYKSK